MITPHRARDLQVVSKPPPADRVSRLKKITILLADDNAIMRQGLSTLLKAEGQFKVIGQARNGREAVVLERTLRPDVVLMDIAMPVLNGLEATRQILAANPAAKVLILSAHSDDAYIERMIAVGAKGFLAKQTAMEFLARAICEVVKGHQFFSPVIAKRMTKARNWSRDHDGLLRPGGVRLTSRETKVLQLVAEGHANRQIAATLGIGTRTVENHRQHAVDKLNLHETADLTRYAISQGIITSRVRLKIA
jgi:DNA-binding NarL/FixJ family response regulator